MFYYNCILSALCIMFWLYLIYATYEIANKRAPFVPAIGRHKKIAIDKISQLLIKTPNKQTVIDAGCGNGCIIAKLAIMFPYHTFIGIEYNMTLYSYCSKRWKHIKNLHFRHQDLLTFDYSQTDIIYYFGIPSLTKQLENILTKTDKLLNIISIEEQFSECYLIHNTPFQTLNGTSYVYHYQNNLIKQPQTYVQNHKKTVL